jgi:hypothetical protein
MKQGKNAVLARWGVRLQVVAVFVDPACAVRWALTTVRLCLDADWDPALLEHELCGE